jgi:uncharacterized membrane protein
LNVSSFHYFPVPLLYVVVLACLVGILIVLLEIRVLGYAFERMGIDRRYVVSILSLCLLGSYVNIPIAELPPEQVVSDQIVRFFGIAYVVPRVEVWPRTVLAINVGGALIPALLSVYLVAKNRLWGRALVAVALVTAVVHRMAYPVPGVGIAVPNFVPAIAAAGVALVLSRESAAALAYVAGSLGTLIGGDLLNLGKLQGLGAPVASIGGAGTFDGVFVSGILAVLLAGIPLRAVPRARRDAAPTIARNGG